MQKGVDKGLVPCYNNTCRRERGQQTRANERAKLENDTETKIEDKKETVRFLKELNALTRRGTEGFGESEGKRMS